MDEPVIGRPTGAPEPESGAAQQDAAGLAGSAAQSAREDLPPGVPIQVAYSGSSRGPAFNSAVVDVTPESVALDLSRGGRPPSGAQGEPLILVVRGRAGFRAFDATVIGVQAPRSLLVVTPPVEARRPERRSAVRAPVGVPLRSGVWLDPRGGEYPIHGGTVIDVSAGGLQLRSLRYVVEGALVRLAFVLHPAERPVHAQGMVVGVEEEARSSALRIHVQFVEMPEDSRAQIDRFVDRAVARRKVA